MRNFNVLLQKELRSFFLSPLAWVIIAMVMLLNAVSFSFSLEAVQEKVSQKSLLYLTFNSLWFWMIFFLLFPLLTMRLFAEERKLGTLETLLTAPVDSRSVVMGKYFATLIFYCVLWIPSALNFQVFEWITGQTASVTDGAFFGAYLILFLVGCFNISIGCFASSLTSNQLIAGVLAFSFITLHFFLGFAHLFLSSQSSELLTLAILDRITYFSTFEHLKTFTEGLIDTRPMVYYLSLSVLFLSLTWYMLERRRWRA